MTPISRPRVKGRADFFGDVSRQLHPFFSFRQRQVLNRARFFTIGCERMRSRQTPMRIKRWSSLAAFPRPGGSAAPEERWFRAASKRFLSFHGCRLPDSNLRLAHDAGDPLPIAAGDGDPASNSVPLVATPVTVPGSPDRRLSFRRSSASHRTAGPPSGCGSRRARACAPTPWWRRYCWSWPSCARRSAWPRGRCGARNWPPRRTPRPDTCCRS